jgi:hypothetical protein
MSKHPVDQFELQARLEKLTRLADGNQITKFDRKQDPIDSRFDYLRIQIKYLLFDLEATRRENKHLRKMLENK